MSILKLLSIVLLIGLAACSKKEVRVPVITAGPPDYEDLRAGDMLRIVLPIRGPGDNTPILKNEEGDGTRISLSSLGLVGYQIVIYSISAKSDGRVKLKFASAELTKNGIESPVSEPSLPFSLPRKAEYIRLIYLQRLSESDHNMAIVASKRMDDLNTLTAQIRNDPKNCLTTQHAVCSWVPAGVAVRPEKTAQN